MSNRPKLTSYIDADESEEVSRNGSDGGDSSLGSENETQHKGESDCKCSTHRSMVYANTCIVASDVESEPEDGGDWIDEGGDTDNPRE